MSKQAERVLGRVLATEELKQVAGGITTPSEDNTNCLVDTLAVQDHTQGGLDDNFDDEQ